MAQNVLELKQASNLDLHMLMQLCMQGSQPLERDVLPIRIPTHSLVLQSRQQPRLSQTTCLKASVKAQAWCRPAEGFSTMAGHNSTHSAAAQM